MGYEVINGDCLVEMPKLIGRGVKVDACITDPPYGTTACAWDSVIPFTPMWANLKRLVKKSGAIVLFGSQPFTSALVMSNPQMFKYEWVWDKKMATGMFEADARPLKAHESVLVFSGSTTSYYPQMRERTEEELKRFSYESVMVEGSRYLGGVIAPTPNRESNRMRFPDSVLRFTGVVGRSGEKQDGQHETQKPVELMRYLVRTYTNEGDTVLDFTMGSGTTGVACAIEGRNFIGIEQDKGYCEIAEARIKRARGIACDIPRITRVEKEMPLFATA